VVVIRPGTGDVALTCGGAAMVSPLPDAAAVSPDTAAGGPQIQVGKRYVSESGDLELLCVKGGQGELAADGEPLRLKESRPLPTSD
jgi:hypothetical protein